MKYHIGVFILWAILPCFAKRPSFVQRAGEFAFDLYENTVAENAYDNVVVSPINVYSALALAYLGSRGQTFMEMSAVLNLGRSPDAVTSKFGQVLRTNENQDNLFNIANNIFYQMGLQINEEFESMAWDPFGILLKAIEFENKDGSIMEINEWIKTNSNYAMQNIMQPNYFIDPNTKALILSAVSFKGKWQRQFHQTHTSAGQFRVSANESVDTPFMSSSFITNYGDFDAFTAVTLPYRNSDLQLLVLLPKPNITLEQLEPRVNFTGIIRILSNMEPEKRVLVRLPKFKSYFTGELRTVLDKMNLGILFKNTSDFSAIGSDIKFDNVIHKMYLSIDEGPQRIVLGRLKPDVRFNANRPFMYLILNPRGVIHAMGRYVKPQG